jgi:predicted ATP-dependent endonuclease of OLD family
MKIKLEHVGIVKHAEINIEGISVIAGENATGKSTVGKALFSVFNGFYSIDDAIPAERSELIVDKLRLHLRISRPDAYEIAIALIRDIEIFLDQKNTLYDFLASYTPTRPAARPRALGNESDLSEVVDKIYEDLAVSDDQILEAIISKNLRTEFGTRISNVNTSEPSRITLTIRNNPLTVIIQGDKVQLQGRDSLDSEAIYIDDPFILDSLFSTSSYSMSLLSSHQTSLRRNHLRRALFSDRNESTVRTAIREVIASKKLEGVLTKLNSVCPGGILTKSNTAIYQDADGNRFDMVSVSTGLKTFIVLKTLLENGSLVEGGTLILDEPEVHLHPEWQLLFAEIIVLLQKEFAMHILLTTHSPYFLDAIDIYSRFHNNHKKCHYYLTELEEGSAVFRDVSTDLERVYAKLAKPFQFLENLTYSDEQNN